jgi:hypothetical protein
MRIAPIVVSGEPGDGTAARPLPVHTIVSPTAIVLGRKKTAVPGLIV